MLFNSFPFIFIFLPIVLLIFFQIGKYNNASASLFLAVSSLFFYAWWDVRFVGLLMLSIVFNYCAGYLISLCIGKRFYGAFPGHGKLILYVAIISNLLLLGYFKYANFFAGNLNSMIGMELPVRDIILPLGISFFTFTQITFLVDTYLGKTKESNFIHYTLFVTYFPHLIAGPVLHHGEMMPQFAKRNVGYVNWNNVAVGLSIFVLGLAKKILIADSVSEFSTPVFDAFKAGENLMFFEAWRGALAYTLQLYFDFSAYSDMAIGLSLMFNVRLPMNFNSPYKSTSIIEFWRRWHMTLSRFLRDYLYIPLGGSRNGNVQRYINLSVTMLLGGLWHGAGWTFVIWGGLHGFYLIVNHLWRTFKLRLHWKDGRGLAKFGAGLLTFLAVVVGWVFFRADSVTAALSMLKGMLGLNGVSLPASWEGYLGEYFINSSGVVFHDVGFKVGETALILGVGFAITFFMPNVRELFQSWQPTCEDTKEKSNEPKYISGLHKYFLSMFAWRGTTIQAICYGVMFFLLISYMVPAGKSEFLYFQF